MTFADDSKGCIVQGFEDTPDANVSIYTGGNLKVEKASESEGSIVVDGNLNNLGGLASLAGKAMWGLGFQPPADATMISIGGNLTGSYRTFAGGNMRIGGSDTNHLAHITTRENLIKLGLTGTDWLNTYPYKNQGPVSVKTNLGKTAALHVDKDGDGTFETDYNNYVSKTLIPLSNQLKALPATGTVTFDTVSGVSDYKWAVSWNNSRLDPNDHRPNPYIKATIPSEGLIRFRGDGQQHRQVFSLDLNQMQAYKENRKFPGGWSLAFDNIPDGQAIIINVTGQSNVTWWAGWRVWVNGVDYSTAVNSHDASLSRFRNIASRIMWNYPDTSYLQLNGAPNVRLLRNDQYDGKGTWAEENNHPNGYDGALFPGSILLPHGNMRDIVDTNGRLLIGKDLTLHIWEHHNAPWIGFDEPQCFTVGGKTTASLS